MSILLVNAHRGEMPGHGRALAWLEGQATGPSPFALSIPAMHGFVRVVTRRGVFDPPTETGEAFSFLTVLIRRPNCKVVTAGERYWDIFESLCRKPDVRGKLVADAAHAALAIEHGCEWVTADTDFARFAPELRWRLL